MIFCKKMKWKVEDDDETSGELLLHTSVDTHKPAPRGQNQNQPKFSRGYRGNYDYNDPTAL